MQVGSWWIFKITIHCLKLRWPWTGVIEMKYYTTTASPELNCKKKMYLIFLNLFKNLFKIYLKLIQPTKWNVNMTWFFWRLSICSWVLTSRRVLLSNAGICLSEYVKLCIIKSSVYRIYLKVVRKVNCYYYYYYYYYCYCYYHYYYYYYWYCCCCYYFKPA